MLLAPMHPPKRSLIRVLRQRQKLPYRPHLSLRILRQGSSEPSFLWHQKPQYPRPCSLLEAWPRQEMQIRLSLIRPERTGGLLPESL